jgi:hypothetical protein
MPQFSDEILDTFGRPKLSELTICGADDLPDLPDYSSFSINNHIFNLNHPNKSALHLHLQLAISRRTNSAGEEYRLARNHLLDYVEDLRIPEHRLKSYLLALTHFEQCIISIHQASELFNKTQSRVLNSPVEPLFKEDKDKGSDLERLNKLYNIAKHFSADQAELSSASIWITNTGLESRELKKKLSFAELQENILACSEVCRVSFVEIPAEVVKQHSPPSDQSG